jgi:Thiamine pyrophosphate enzyme, C-terminal TPP binding domain
MMHQAVEYERGLVTLWALMGELLTAVHHRLPVKVVIFDNAAFGLITLEAQSEGLLPFQQAIEFPNPDYEAAYSADPDQPFRPIVITDSGDRDHDVHRA